MKTAFFLSEVTVLRTAQYNIVPSAPIIQTLGRKSSKKMLERPRRRELQAEASYLDVSEMSHLTLFILSCRGWNRE